MEGGSFSRIFLSREHRFLILNNEKMKVMKVTYKMWSLQYKTFRNLIRCNINSLIQHLFSEYCTVNIKFSIDDQC